MQLIEIAHFSRFNITVGGGFDVINAATDVTGPSLRMIVQLTDTIEAYGIYVGGQSGNPGSRYYESFIDDWAAGKYYKLWFMQPGEKDSDKIKWAMNFNSK
jgi:penicillin amidase